MLIDGARKRLAMSGGLVLLASGVLLTARTTRSNAGTATASVSTDKVLRYVRERFGVPANIKMTADPLRDSLSPDFYQTVVTADDGKQKKTNTVFVSKDGHYLILGNLYKLNSPDSKAEILQDIRDLFKVPATTSLTVGSPEPSNFAGFNKFKVIGGDGASKDFYLTRDNRILILGNVFNLVADPRREVLRIVNMVNQPGVGPAHAPVTIVEYADLECPSCARMHEFLEKDLLPKYGDRVRIIFKEFPLVNVHVWAWKAAIANECAYEIDPTKFLPYRTLIFQHQNDIDAVQTNPITVRDLLLSYGEQVGIDRLRLSQCIDAEGSKARVKQGAQEADLLSVASTPTFFINGKILVGMAPPEDFYKAVDEALRAAGEVKAVGRKQ